MPTPPTPTGRTVKDTADKITDLANQAIDASTEPLGSTDPVKFQEAAKKTIRLLNRIVMASNQISQICTIAAVRGPYGEGDESE